jgi:hypothetical protein
MTGEKVKKQEPENFILTDKEKKVIEHIRSIDHGEITVLIQDKIPIRVRETQKNFKI